MAQSTRIHLSAEIYTPDIEQLFSNALLHCTRTLNLELTSVIIKLKQGKHTVHSTLRYSLGKQAAVSIGEGVSGVTAIYLFGSSAKGEAGPHSDIDLLLQMESQFGSLKPVQELSKDMAEYYCKFIFSESKCRELLEIRLIMGPRDLLPFLHDPPLLLWQG